MTTSKTFRRGVSALLIATAAATAPFAAPVANAQGYFDALGPVADAVIGASGSIASIGESISAGSSTGPELTQVDSLDNGRYAGT